VEGCLRKKLDSVHLVRVPAEMEGVLESAVGNEVEVEVDWERRMDHVSGARFGSASLRWVHTLRRKQLCISCSCLLLPSCVLNRTSLLFGWTPPSTRRS
jgi:hypothetical protein